MKRNDTTTLLLVLCDLLHVVESRAHRLDAGTHRALGPIFEVLDDIEPTVVGMPRSERLRRAAWAMWQAENDAMIAALPPTSRLDRFGQWAWFFLAVYGVVMLTNSALDFLTGFLSAL